MAWLTSAALGGTVYLMQPNTGYVDSKRTRGMFLRGPFSYWYLRRTKNGTR